MQYGKVPPHAKDLEKEVLAAILTGTAKASDVFEILTDADMFYVPMHQTIAGMALSMTRNGLSVDLLTVMNELQKNGEIEQIGGAYALTALTNSANFTTEAKVIVYSKIIKKKYYSRRLITIGSEIVSKAFDDEDVDDLIYSLNLELEKISTDSTEKIIRPITDVLVDVYENISKEINQDVHFTGVDTGLPKLNSITGGWQKTDLIIIAARPAVGKTAFALNLAFAASEKVNTAVFNLEMSSEQLGRRLVSISTQIPLTEISKPYKIEDKDVKMYQISNDVNLQNRKLFINDSPGLKVSEMKAMCVNLKKKYGLGLIIIDYLQLMEGERENGNREQEISKISRGLKKVAKELDVPIIALSQLSRSVETRGADAVPRLADLRESGAIEQDADIVGFLYNATPSEIKDKPEMKDVIHLNIMKNRNGVNDDLLFIKNLSIQKFSENRSILSIGNQDNPNEVFYNPNAGFANVQPNEVLPF